MEQTLPHDEHTERSVLGTIIRYNEYFHQNADILRPDLFYDNVCKEVYIAAQKIVDNGGVTDMNSLSEAVNAVHMNTDDKVYREQIHEIITSCNEHALQQDIERLQRMATQRALWEYFTRAAQNVIQPLADVDEEIDNLREKVNNVRKNPASVDATDFSQALDQLQHIVQENYLGHHSSLQTGFRLFDNYYLLRPDTLTVIAAFTSVGKTALALNIAQNVAEKGIPIAIYSLEMGCVELTSRIIAAEAQMPASTILNRKLEAYETSAFEAAVKKYRRLPLYFDDDASITFERTMRSIRTMVQTHGIKLAVIDYLQIYNQNADSTESSLAAMARESKNIAKELHIPIILISQLNRSALHPSIRMLRGSGQIEESADNIVLIDRPAAYPDNPVSYEGEFHDQDINGTAKLILSKGRGVGTGVDLVNFDAQYTKFSDRPQTTSSTPRFQPQQTQKSVLQRYLDAPF